MPHDVRPADPKSIDMQMVESLFLEDLVPALFDVSKSWGCTGCRGPRVVRCAPGRRGVLNAPLVSHENTVHAVCLVVGFDGGRHILDVSLSSTYAVLQSPITQKSLENQANSTF